jgi:tyrosine-protein kinase Etk/Wzc
MNDNFEKQIGINDYIRIFLRGKWIILISALTVFSIVAYYTFTATPIYRATAKVMFKENKAAEQTLFNITNFGEKATMINNQVQILHSRTLAEKVVKKLRAASHADQLDILGERPGSGRSGVGILGRVKGLLSGIFSDNGNGHDRYARDEREISFNRAVEQLMNTIAVNPIRNTDVVELSVTATSPFEAAFVTNTLATVYKSENQLENQAEVRRVKDFLAEQLELIQNQLSQSEMALKNYMEREKVVALPEETQEMVTRVAEFESLYRGALLELESTQERLNYVDGQLDRSKQNFSTESLLANPFIEEIKKQMTELETRKATYIAGLINRGIYSEDDPTIRDYDEKIELLSNEFKARIARLASSEIGNPLTFSESLFQRKIELEAEIQSLNPRVAALESIVNEYNAQLEEIPEKSLKLARLERSAKLDEKITLMMKEKYEESRITEVGQLGNIRIIDPAKEPVSPISPKKRLNLMLGLIIGLGLGVGITLLLDYFDNSVHSLEELEKMNIPALGAIPLIKTEQAVAKHGRNGKSKNKMKHIGSNGNGSTALISRLIVHFAPKSPISEAYRSLRTNIQFSRPDGELKTMLVTSPGPQEGKSTTIANLAITMAQMGSKVLLVDTDLRRPILHSIFGLSRSVGISNYLIGRVPLEEAVFDTNIDNLYLMPSGTLPPNPSELLSSTAMKECVATLKEKFDYVFFDSPPVIAVTDASVLGTKVDGVILVVKASQTDRRAIERAHNTLKHICPEQFLGAVINVVNVEGSYGSYYYYYYHNYYGNRNSNDKSKKSFKYLTN